MGSLTLTLPGTYRTVRTYRYASTGRYVRMSEQFTDEGSILRAASSFCFRPRSGAQPFGADCVRRDRRGVPRKGAGGGIEPAPIRILPGHTYVPSGTTELVRTVRNVPGRRVKVKLSTFPKRSKTGLRPDGQTDGLTENTSKQRSQDF